MRLDVTQHFKLNSALEDSQYCFKHHIFRDGLKKEFDELIWLPLDRLVKVYSLFWAKAHPCALNNH